MVDDNFIHPVAFLLNEKMKMEATQAEEKRKPIPTLKGRVCNELLLCRKYEVEEKIGSLYLTSEDGGTDLRDNIQKKAEIVLVSKKLIPYMDEFEVGDIVQYPTGTRELKIWIEDEPYFLIHKKDVVYVEQS